MVNEDRAPESSAKPFLFVLLDVLAALPVHGMPPAERAILGAIAGHADRAGGNAYPSMARISRLTGYGVSTIVRAVEELIARRWLRRVTRRDERTGGATSNLYTVLLDGEPWGDEQARKRRRAPPAKRRNQVSAPEPTPLRAADTPSPPIGITLLQSADTPSPPGGHPLSAGRQQTSHDLPENLPQRSSHEPPHVGGRDKPQIVIPFGPSPIDTPIPGSKIRKKPARDPEAGKGKPAERYLDAFVAALEAEGRTITRPRTSEGAQLGRIAAAHAKRDGHPITGAALIGWIGDITRRFVRAVERPEVHRGGISVFGLQTWLDNQRPGDADPEDDDVPPGEPVPPAVPRLPPVTFTREELRPALQQVLEVANRGRAARGLAPMTLAEVEAAGSS